jgi:hypothetical protein
MPDQATLSPIQFLVFGFGPDASFEGQLVGALERIEVGGALRILDTLFMQRDAATGELAAIELSGDGAGGIVAPLLGFRLDPAERRRATERALRRSATGVSGDTLVEVGQALEPGAALAAVLVEHRWAEALQDAVSRLGGKPLASAFVDARALEQLISDLLAAARRSREPDPA